MWGRFASEGTISSREDTVPTRANAPAQLNLDNSRRGSRRFPGVGAADGLSFVDLPPGSLQRPAPPSTAGAGLRLRRTYQRHYPSIQLAAGSFRPGSALLSAEASRALGAEAGSHGRAEPARPARAAAAADQRRGRSLAGEAALLQPPVDEARGLSLRARTRSSSAPSTFEDQIVPAFQALPASARERSSRARRCRRSTCSWTARGSTPIRRLRSAQTKAIAQSINRIAPRSGLPDRQHLEHAPGRERRRGGGEEDVLLPRSAGRPAGRLPRGLRRQHPGERAATRQRQPAPPRRPPRSPAPDARSTGRWRSPASAPCSGAGLGLLSVMVILGGGTALRRRRRRPRLVSPGRGRGRHAHYGIRHVRPRAAVAESRGQPGAGRDGGPAAHRLGTLADRLDPSGGSGDRPGDRPSRRSLRRPPGSVYEGESTSLPSHLMLAPLVAWIGGMLLAIRFFDATRGRDLRCPRRPDSAR